MIGSSPFSARRDLLAASQTRDKDALTKEGVEKVLMELKETFEYVVCDSPAGIETGAHLAMYFADEAIVVTNPEVSSVRDSDRMLGLLASKSRRAEKGEDPIKEHLLLTRYNPDRVSKGDSYDNALAETINGLYKAELIYRQSWKSREAVEMATLKWVHWYNPVRHAATLKTAPHIYLRLTDTPVATWKIQRRLHVLNIALIFKA